MTSRRVYRMSDDDAIEPARGVVNGLFITTIFWIGVGLGFVLGKYLP